ncbi:MAG: excinuclease ABC subunit UvrA, partial [Alphaproteobacteria bacterium]|nr:excinuclease ABC subunit UvrA [Alphaproteobacteria bacterium]
MSTDQIVVLGAREHNLQDVDLTLPRDSLVVFSGLSGSGKSSLAFDTIYQEGQRRFMESLSAYARQFLGKMEKPDVDHVEGLSPTISIDQKTVNRNPRSTVGTVTEILDHLRLLLARLGTPHCPLCATPISALSPAQIAQRILDLHPGARVMVLAPIVRDRKGEYRKELEDLRKDGWVRARVDGELRRLDEDIALARYEKHTIEVVLDRLRAVPESRPRAVEAVERALGMSEGVVSALVEITDPGSGEDVTQHLTWSSDRACPNHPEVAIPELEPRLFSFNAPQGACPDCNGLGELVGFDPSLMVDPDARVLDALKVWNDEGRLPFSSVSEDIVRDLIKHVGGDLRRKWRDQPQAVQDAVLLGEGVDWSYRYTVEQGRRTIERTRRWSGIAPSVENIFHFTKYKGFERFRRRRPCPGCHGARLNPIALAVTFRDTNIATLSSMRVTHALEFFQGVRLSGPEQLIGRELVRELRDRLSFLDQVGLGYLSIDRSSVTLSGGEAQRIRLAAQVGSGLQGVTYVLDEPSIGLHARDNKRLLDTLLRLRDQGNTVLVVEHDRETMEAADHLVDVGPGAGVEGGHVVASGRPAELRTAEGATLAYLRGEDHLPLPASRRAGNGQALTVVNARENNLRGVTVAIPLGCFVAVSGVSGSGKSSLIVQTLERALNERMRKDYKGEAPGLHDRVEGIEHIDKLIVIDQSPIGRTPRSNPATYTGLFDDVRALFAKLPEARARGYKPGRFSFNVPGGRCEECSGA